jgi:hypothetical protein
MAEAASAVLKHFAWTSGALIRGLGPSSEKFVDFFIDKNQYFNVLESIQVPQSLSVVENSVGRLIKPAGARI